MPIETIEFNGQQYPKFQSEGNAARWIMPFALKVCQPTGEEIGFDIGCNRKQWAMPGANCIDPSMTVSFDAYNLPTGCRSNGAFYNTALVDYIFSSHCLEHLPKWVDALDYWHSRLKPGGVCFLYLPDQSQQYWFPTSNRKHIHSFNPDVIRMYFELSRDDKQQPMWKNVFVSGVDLNNSFCCIAEKI
jgi:trans-aconitate methyltransferase